MTASEALLSPLAEIIEGIETPLLVVSLDGDVVASNRAFDEAFGAAPGTVAELERVDRADATSRVDLASLLRAGGSASGTLTVRVASGDAARAGFSLTPVGGSPPAAWSILALELEPTNAIAIGPELVALAESAPCVVWVADADGTVVLTNDRWRATFGDTPSSEAVPGSAATIHPEDYEECRARWELSLRDGGPYEATARHRVGTRAFRRFLTRAVPLTSEAGAIVGWLGTTTEVGATVDDRVSGASSSDAAGGDRASDTLLSTASHELRGPLTVMQGTVQLAQRRAASRALTSDEVSELLGQIGEQTQRALQLVEQLLDHARVTMDRLALHAVPTDVTVLAQNVATAIKGANDSHEIEVHAPTPCIAEVDGPRIEQVLFNLLDNALKFSRAGSRIDVTVTLVERGGVDVVEIGVRDRGRGVPRAERARIFERFHQVAGADAERGLGVGLAVSKEIVELHGGAMLVGTPRGGGTRFIVQLPVRLEPPRSEASEPVGTGELPPGEAETSEPAPQ